MRWIARLVQNVLALRRTKNYDIFLSICLAAITAVVATELVNFLIYLYPSLIPEGLSAINESLRESDGSMLLTFLVAVCVIAPILEELVFRGALWWLLEKFLPTNAVWIITSILFAMAHIDILHVIAVFPLGALFGYLRKKTGSIWAPMIAHATNNILASLTLIF
tara:strand:+ start:14493 stop:14987 length:495 start_codon:yes stop_codon:yes gene_type:complete